LGRFSELLYGKNSNNKEQGEGSDYDKDKDINNNNTLKNPYINNNNPHTPLPI